MTRKDLIAIARERGMVGYGKMNKADLAERLGINLIHKPKLTEEQKKENRKAYRDKNRDSVNDYRRRYNEEHPGKMRQYRLNYYKKWDKNVDILMAYGVRIEFYYCPRISRHARVMKEMRGKVPLVP